MFKVPACPDRGFFIEVVLAALIVFMVALTLGLLTGAEPGSLAEWVGGISTLAAFVAAVIAARYAADAYTLGRQREDRWEETQRRAQASLVAGWCTTALYGRGPRDGNQ